MTFDYVCRCVLYIYILYIYVFLYVLIIYRYYIDREKDREMEKDIYALGRYDAWPGALFDTAGSILIYPQLYFIVSI